MLNNKFFKDEKVLSLLPIERLLFAALWGLADREGLLEDKPFEIWMEFGCIDYHSKYEVDEALNHIYKAGLIERFEDSGVKCIYINNFQKYQRPHPKETKSELIKHLAAFREITGKAVKLNGKPCNSADNGIRNTESNSNSNYGIRTTEYGDGAPSCETDGGDSGECEEGLQEHDDPRVEIVESFHAARQKIMRQVPKYELETELQAVDDLIEILKNNYEPDDYYFSNREYDGHEWVRTLDSWITWLLHFNADGFERGNKQSFCWLKPYKTLEFWTTAKARDGTAFLVSMDQAIECWNARFLGGRGTKRINEAA